MVRIATLLQLWVKLTYVLILSTVLGVAAASAHEVRPSVADITISPDRVEMTVQLTAEALLAGVDLSTVDDTNDAPEAEEYDALRAVSAEDLAERFRIAWPELSMRFDLRTGDTRLDLELETVTVSEEPDLDVPRDSTVILSTPLPAGDDPVTVAWDATLGALVLRQTGGGEDAYTGYLEQGARSEPLPRDGALTEGIGSVVARYIILGFEHIVPKGLDHILFVLGLFFFSLRLGPILWQVSAFTLAHTVTLALASLGYVSIPGSIVEPLIAASIVYVAVENILRPQLGWWRTALVFGFGLLHGLGFASVLGDIGLDPARFITGLIAFNIGVELGQLAVIAAAFLAVAAAQAVLRREAMPGVGITMGVQDTVYRSISVVGSILIALAGARWVVERTLL
ncbi:HupE/UreJ family protein [Actibacterium sp. 188UL27-1]|uniref:HupE/UreJ family protein n=1 Tax=Actibacterium sp. 188UL27-1 TaxID=2786961 RepID=UPI0019582132|nr:HupE/UreJ family protein [Actibacterium sp. 188UL27-1]MBM7070389.1 HupE/UreJ family protein [Actibacterium sp. 188UL27-1]